MNEKQYEEFREKSIELGRMDEKEGLEQRDHLLENYLKMATTNSCMFPGMVSQEYQDACDDRNHSQMGVLFGQITKLTHEFEGIQGIVDIVEKIRRVHTEMMQKMIEKNEKENKEEK